MTFIKILFIVFIIILPSEFALALQDDQSHQEKASNSNITEDNIIASLAPALSISHELLDFGLVYQTLTTEIYNTGSDLLIWNVMENPDESWMHIVGEHNGTLESGKSKILRVDVDRAGHRDGIKYNELLIVSNAGNAIVDVIVEIGDFPTSPVLQVSPDVLNFYSGITTLPLIIKNRGVSSLAWCLSDKPKKDWIILPEIKQGSLNSMEEQEVEINVDRSFLNSGIYTGLLLIESNAGSANVEVEIIAGQTPNIIRVNVGDSSYTDIQNRLWSTDRPYVTNSWGYIRGHPYCVDTPIAGTLDDDLYCSERFWLDKYLFDLPDGGYTVILHFAELYYDFINGRVFNVYIENKPVLNAFDIFAQVGFHRATQRVFKGIQLDDCQMEIRFEQTKAHAKLSAIEIISESAPYSEISVNPPLLRVTAKESAANPSDEIITIRNIGQHVSHWTAGQIPGHRWLSLENIHGNSGDGVNLKFDTQGLPVGIYDSNVRIYDPCAMNNPLDVPIHLTVTPNPAELHATPLELDFGYVQNQMQFIIKNDGGDTLHWNAVEAPDELWIKSIEAVDGSLALGESDTIKIYVDRSCLNDGFFSGSVRVLSNGGDCTVAIKISSAEFPPFAGPVTDLSINQCGTSGIQLNWSQTEYATGYKIYRNINPFFSPEESFAVIENTCFVDDNSIGDPDSNYYYVVTAVNDLGESDISNRVGEFDFSLDTTVTTDFNEIALPLVMEELTKASDLMRAIPGCNSVACWNACFQGYEQYVEFIPPTDFELKQGHPYYVNVTDRSVFTLTGYYSDPIFSLLTTQKTDFNEIMLPLKCCSITLASELMDAIPNCNSVARWNVLFQGYEQYVDFIPPTNFAVKAGYPYYVNVADTTTWPGRQRKTSVKPLADRISGKVPHLVYGKLNFDITKRNASTMLQAHIKSKSSEILTDKSPGCGLIDDGLFWIQLAGFTTPWQIGEILRIDFFNDTGRWETVAVGLTANAADEVLLDFEDTFDKIESAGSFELIDNYPNPFNAMTRISYQLAVASDVRLMICNLNGQLIETLVNTSQAAGVYHVLWNAQDVSSGLYLYKLSAGEFSESKKCLLLR